MRIAFGNDHAALNMRKAILEHLHNAGHQVIDLGTAAEDSVDYPDFAAKACQAVQKGEADCAILTCGTGIGMSIAANKMRGIRCALCTDEYGAKMAREHNDANVIALRGRRMDAEHNLAILDCFLNTRFEGGRHQRRVDKIADLEKNAVD
jgi:ribose 5-phosphate isomerase B